MKDILMSIVTGVLVIVGTGCLVTFVYLIGAGFRFWFGPWIGK